MSEWQGTEAAGRPKQHANALVEMQVLPNWGGGAVREADMPRLLSAAWAALGNGPMQHNLLQGGAAQCMCMLLDI